MQIVLPPLKWDHTNDGPDFSDLFRRLEDYERSHLRSNTVFPAQGQVWETVRDCEINYEACFAWPGPRFNKLQLPSGKAVTVFGSSKPAQFFPFGTTQLQKGERARVIERADLRGFTGCTPLWASLQPLRYRELEDSIVSRRLRNVPGFTGYRLNIRTARSLRCLYPEKAYLNEDFRLLEGVAEP